MKKFETEAEAVIRKGLSPLPDGRFARNEKALYRKWEALAAAEALAEFDDLVESVQRHLAKQILP